MNEHELKEIADSLSDAEKLARFHRQLSDVGEQFKLLCSATAHAQCAADSLKAQLERLRAIKDGPQPARPMPCNP